MEKIMITCPECKHEFSPDQSLKHQLDHMMQEERKRIQTTYDKKEKALKQLQNQLNQKETEIEKLVSDRLSAEKRNLKVQVEQKLKEEFNTEVTGLRKELFEKQHKLNQAKELELEIERMKRDAESRETEIRLELEKELSAKQSQIEQQIVQREAEKNQLKLADKEKQLTDLKDQLEIARRKAEQGSQQLQGDVQEVALEDLLRSRYPLDEVKEVKKGINGADVIHTVKNQYGHECGIIALESKRAKSFSEKWIYKLKEDMKIHRADVGVIVTETMPTDMTGFGLLNGIWICSFAEVEGLTSVLRESVLQIHQSKQTLVGKGEKMELLYEYLCSTEFKHQIEGIVEGFSSMKVQLDREKRAMKSIWKEREKQIDRIFDNTLNMYGSIKGIAGNSVIEIEQLELETRLLSEPEN